MGWKVARAARVALFEVVDGISPGQPRAVSGSKPDRRKWALRHEPSERHLCPKCSGFGTVKNKAPGRFPRGGVAGPNY